MSQRHQNIVAVFLVLKKDSHVLLLQRQNTGYEDGNFSVIAGHVEKGESCLQALTREAAEEANITFSPKDILWTHTLHRKSDWDSSERIEVFFLLEKWGGEIMNKEPEKCAQLDWFPVHNLPNNTISSVKGAIQSLLSKESYSEVGWE